MRISHFACLCRSRTAWIPPRERSLRDSRDYPFPTIHQFHGSDQWLKDLAAKDLCAIRRGVLKFRGAPRPFVWTASAITILEKVSRGRQTLESVRSNAGSDRLAE